MAPYWIVSGRPGVGLSQDDDSLERPLLQTVQAVFSSDKDEIDLETRIGSRSGGLCIYAPATLQCSQRTFKCRQESTSYRLRQQVVGVPVKPKHYPKSRVPTISVRG